MKNTHNELNELALQAKAGDREAEEGVYVKLSGLVFLLGRRHRIKGAEPEDVLQEGFIAIHSAIDGYNADKGNFYAFARQCIENRMLTSVKASNREKHKYLNQYISLYRPVSDDGDDELLEYIADGAPDLDDEIIKKEEMEEWKQKIELTLTGLEKDVLDGYLEGKSYNEIAAAMGIGAKSVDNALRRIKKKLGSN